MAETAFILSTRPGHEAVAIPVPLDQPPAQAAEAVREALGSAGCSGRPAVLALPSASCLCAAIRSHDLPPKGRTRALLYRLEEKLPVAAEDFVADFVVTSDGALGICTLRAEIAPLLEALEGQGIPIAAVCPATLLAMQHRLESDIACTPADGLPHEPFDAVILGREGEVELLLLDAGRPRGWHVFPDDPKALLLHLRLEAFNGNPLPRNALAIGLPEAVFSALVKGSGMRVTLNAAESIRSASPSPGTPNFDRVDKTNAGTPTGACTVGSSPPHSLGQPSSSETHGASTGGRSKIAVRPATVGNDKLSTGGKSHTAGIDAMLVCDLAADMAERILSGRAEPWLNLRAGFGAQDRLRPVRGPLRYAAAAVALCLLSACGAIVWRAARYDRLAAHYADEQREVFRRTFPRQPEPTDVPSRLASEERGLRGLSGDSSAPPPQPPGLVALRDLLARLPEDVRFRVLELRLDGASFVLEGQARSHGDADAIAVALRTGGGFSVDPPRTEQLNSPSGTANAPASAIPASADKVVAFTLTGAVVSDMPAARRAAP